MKHLSFEIKYLSMSPFTFALLIQFAILMWLQRNIKKPFIYLFYPLAAIFLIEDFIYQIIPGTIMFGELPKDILFTGRLNELIRQTRQILELLDSKQY